ncbi:hypothetical protein Tco_0017792 [Tanacetum coccineum]
MANLSEDIQCAGSDTRPPMLDRTDFFIMGKHVFVLLSGVIKENGVNILKSIDERPFRMGTFQETLIEGSEVAPNLVQRSETEQGLRDSNYDQLYAYLKQHEAHANENKMMMDQFTQHTVDPLALMNQAIVQDGRVVVQNVQDRHNRGQGNNARGRGAAGYGGAHNRIGNANPGQARKIKYYNCNAQENGLALDEEQLLFIAGGQDNAFDKDVDEQPVQDLALNVDNVFQADDYDAFDSDVDEAPTAQTMFMANLSSVDPVYDESSPSYDSDILSEVHDHDHYQDVVCEHHEEHEMHDDVQPNYIVDSHADYTSDSNMISYEHYVKDNAVSFVQSNVSSVPNDEYMMIFNDMHETHAQPISVTTQNIVVANSLTAELAIYKEQVELYERRARFTKMHDAHTIVEARCLELEVGLSNLREKIQNDNHNEDTPDFDSAFVIGKMKASLQGKDNIINKLKTQISHMQETRSETDVHCGGDLQGPIDSQITQTKMKSVIKDHVKPTVLEPGKYAIDVEPIPPRNRNNREVHLDYLKHLKESVETLREIVEEAKVGTCPKDFNKRDKKHAPTPLISKKQVTFE